jgi:hypothetical protein
MPFYPLPLSYCTVMVYHQLEGYAKILSVPFVCLAVAVGFTIDILSFPFRFCVHEVTHIYSDRDESEWVHNFTDNTRRTSIVCESAHTFVDNIRRDSIV